MTPTVLQTPSAPAAKQGLYIKTYGCQMNVYDSDQMAALLNPLGYTLVDTPEQASLAILNTCHIRDKAAEKMYSDLGRLQRVQKKCTQAQQEYMIAVAGCVAQAEGAEILRRAPYVNMVVGPQAYHTLPEMLAKARRQADTAFSGKRGVLNTDFPAVSKFDFLPQPEADGQVSTFLTIQEGCDKFCSFCVVPYTRGAEYSRPVADILREARRFIAGGTRELVLLGQNVNAYHGEAIDGSTWGLARMLQELANIEGIERLRYTTSHPRDMDADLIKAHGDIPALMPFLHLPVQSGSDRILAKMNRKHTADDYRRTIDALRQARSDMTFSSDFIVGYPGESDADFTDTMRLIEDVQFAQAYSFAYSARPGTPASTSPDALSHEEKMQRLHVLQARLLQQQRTFNQQMVGQTLPVLFEKPGKQAGQMVGKTPYHQFVHVEATDHLLGSTMAVTITAAPGNTLTGTIITSNQAHAA